MASGRHVLTVALVLLAAVLGHGWALPSTTRNPFLPAPPGFRPRCALPGLTFCEDTALQADDGYPIDTIEKLLQNSGRSITEQSPVSSKDLEPNYSLYFGDESEGDQEPKFGDQLAVDWLAAVSSRKRSAVLRQGYPATKPFSASRKTSPIKKTRKRRSFLPPSYSAIQNSESEIIFRHHPKYSTLTL